MMRNKKQAILIVLLIALLLLGAVGGTLAYLKTQTSEVENVFQPARVPSEVEETFSNNVKRDVKIRNNGNVPAYIRAAIVVTWKDAQGNIYPQNPAAGEDYRIVGLKDSDSNWIQSGDYYYYTKPVVAGGLTRELFTSCTPVAEKTPAGYFLNVEIIGQAIQAGGIDSTDNKHPVEQAWGVTVNNNDTPNDYSDDTISAGN